jgi:hypothetical protein
MTDRINEPGEGPASRRVPDALAKWKAEAAAASPALEEVRLDQNEKLVVPFTTSVVEVALHYLDFASLPGYVRCNGPGCLLCRIGRKEDTRDLWPVYVVAARAVGVLPVPGNMRPQALKPQLIGVLKRLKADERPLLAIRKLDRYRFSVSTLPLQKGADDGADVIADFLERYESGAIDLGCVYPRLSNEQVTALPEVATVLKVRGIQP